MKKLLFLFIIVSVFWAVGASALSIPDPQEPLNYAEVSSNPTLKWYDPTPARYYKITISGPTSFSTIVSQTSSWDSSQTILKNGSYTWNVKGCDDIYGTSCGGVYDPSNNLYRPSFVLTKTTVNLTCSNIQLIKSDNNDPQVYKILITGDCSDCTINSFAVDFGDGKTATKSPSSCKANEQSGTGITCTFIHTYRESVDAKTYKIKAKTTSNIPLTNPTQEKICPTSGTNGELEIQGVVKAPTSLSPCNINRTVSVRPTLSWSGSAWTFKVYLNSSWFNNFTSNSVNLNNIREIPALSPGPYTWYVDACNSAGTCAKSSVCQFTVKSDSTDPGGGGGTLPPGGNDPTPTDNCPAGQLCNPLGYSSFDQLVSVITTFIFTISIPIAVLMFVISGLMFVISGGDPQKVTTAKHVALYTAIGIGVIMIASGLVKVLQSLLQG